MGGQSNIDDDPAATLIALAQRELGNLFPAEAEVLRAVAAGRDADLSAYAKAAEGPTLTKETPWGEWAKWNNQVLEARRLRPALLRVLFANAAARTLLPPRGVWIGHAYVEEALDLSCLDVPVPLMLGGCVLPGGVNLQLARTRLLNLRGSHCGGIIADGVEVDGGLFLRGGFQCKGQIRLLGAKITGNLECDGATLDAGEKDASGNFFALTADGVEVGGGLFLRDGFKSKGQVRLLNAKITDDLACDGATLDAGEMDADRDFMALVADRILVGGGIYLRDGFKSKGQVRLLNAKITASLECHGASLDAGEIDDDGDFFSLHADGVQVGGDVFLHGGFKSKGQVRLLGAKITGNLECDGATLDACEKDADGNFFALTADRVEVGGSVFLRPGKNGESCTVHGSISFPGHG